MRVRLLISMTGIMTIMAGRASAEPWSITPQLGVSGEYDTNPGLQQIDPRSEEHVAALFNLPLRYDMDGFGFALTPSGRISNSRGYSSLASDYERLDSSAAFTDERDSAFLQGELSRDSSLYHAGGLTNGIGARRDTSLAAADWTRYLTERSTAQLDLNWTRVGFSSSTFNPFLIDYRYYSAGPTFAFLLDERDTLKVLGNYGQYQSTNGLTASKSESLQLGFVRQLTALWSLSTTAGYSRSQNSEKEFFGPFYLGEAKFQQVGTVYSATLTRQGERFNLSGGVSRALQPTGLAYLSLQTSVNLGATYILDERWNFALNTAWQKALIPNFGNTGNVNVKYLNSQLTANWNWTEQWVVSVHFDRISQEFGPPTYSAASSGVSIDIVRHFLRTDL